MRCHLALLAVAAFAMPVSAAPPLRTLTTDTFTIDVPRGWTVKLDEAKGTLIAIQDPKRIDSPMLLVVATEARAEMTADGLVELVLAQAGTDARVLRREAIAGRVQTLIAEGTRDNLRIRLGAVAAVEDGMGVLAMLVSRAERFDALGGIDTLMAVLASLKPKTSAKKTAPAGKAAVPEGVYLGVDMKTVDGPYGATMTPRLVWYWFSRDGWFDWRWMPPTGLAIRRTGDAMPYAVRGGKLVFTSRQGNTWERTFERLGKDRIKIGHIRLTRVDKGYDRLALHGTYRSETIRRVNSVGDLSGKTGTTGSSRTTMTFHKNGRVEEGRSIVASTDLPGVSSGGASDRRRTGTYAIAANTITLTWSDGTQETRTFATFDGSTRNPKAIVIENALYERQ